MKNTKKTLSLIVALIIFLALITPNVIIALKVNQYNDLIKFANQNYQITDNTPASFTIYINPLEAVAGIQLLDQKTDNTQEEIIALYNNLVDKINQLNIDISQIRSQASALQIQLEDEFTPSNAFSKTDIFDQPLYLNAKTKFSELSDYKLQLQSLFDAFRQSKKQMGDFANPLWGKSDADIQRIINDMSVEDKAGQLLFFSLIGTRLNESQLARYKALNPGGVIIMNNNASSESQLKALTKQIQSINPVIPMFVPADQEGGPVKRVSWDTTKGQKYWAAMSDTDLCNEAKQRANLLLDLGINMNYSPVVDLTYPGSAFINNRTISSDPKIVSAKANIYIDCGQELGIIDTLKHYPGHGPTTQDSHYTLPFVGKSQADWLATDAVPFKENLDAKQIMVAHLVYEKIDPDHPSSLSKIFITDILRNDWGYKGLIITDDMNMLHTSTGIIVKDALRDLFNAGNDMAIYVGAPTSFEDVKAQLVSLIESEEISADTINSALSRILLAKRDLLY